MSKLVECVPNFSEGRNSETIEAISNAIKRTSGCALLDVDPGTSTNRTVYTFVGEPKCVLQGALAAARVAYELIDMTTQKGEHPRVGAMDVCPFIPIRNITIDECVELSKQFGKMLADELHVPVYLYGESQPLEYRKELSSIRQGEYEGLEKKITSDARMKPDFGPSEFVPRYGASCVGARNFLIAYNVNVLGTKEQAHRIALNVREQGRSEKEPGRCPKVKAIGWWLEEERMAQISMNLVDFKTTNLEKAFEECDKDAQSIQVSTCGTQLVGLVPLEAILMAADYYIKKDNLLVLEEENKVKLVIQRLGLNSIGKFNPRERIIEYLLEDKLPQSDKKYQNMPINKFIELVAARSSIPGGGCVAALVSSLGSALACMISLLTYGNRKFERHDAKVRGVLPTFYDKCDELMKLIDQDALAFDTYVEARRLPVQNESDKLSKEEACKKGLYRCMEVPFSVMEKSVCLWPHLKEVAPIFNIDAKSDLLVAVKCLETGIYGAMQNVLINATSFNGNDEHVNAMVKKAESMWTESRDNAKHLIELIETRKN